jgi:hypothetical protein
MLEVDTPAEGDDVECDHEEDIEVELVVQVVVAAAATAAVATVSVAALIEVVVEEVDIEEDDDDDEDDDKAVEHEATTLNGSYTGGSVTMGAHSTVTSLISSSPTSMSSPVSFSLSLVGMSVRSISTGPSKISFLTVTEFPLVGAFTAVTGVTVETVVTALLIVSEISVSLSTSKELSLSSTRTALGEPADITMSVFTSLNTSQFPDGNTITLSTPRVFG